MSQEGLGNGYAEPFRQLVEVSREQAQQSTEQTLLLRQIATTLERVEDRHRESSEETREVVKTAATSVQTVVLAEMKSGEGWWKKAVIILGVAGALGGANSVAHLVELLFSKHT